MSGQIRQGAARTGTPLIVGYVVAAVIEQGVNLTGNSQTILALALAWVYYVVVRFLEVNLSPRWSYILGSSQTAVFASPPVATVGGDGESVVVDEGGVETVE